MTAPLPLENRPKKLLPQGPFHIWPYGIRDHPTASRSPWQNGHAERLIGSIRRECLDHTVVFSEAHLRRIAAAYTGYYNECRTHLSLDKDSPNHRSTRRRSVSSLLGRSSADFIISIVGSNFWSHR